MPEERELTARMVSIGMLLSAKGEREADIEQTLVHASVAGMEDGDLRALAILTTWLQVHHTRVNVQRLVRLVEDAPDRTRDYWAAVPQVVPTDRRFVRLARTRSGPAIDLVEASTGFLVQRRGEDPRFKGTPLRVAAGVLRDRTEDVMTEEQLTGAHRGYRNRIVLGPTWRADVWTCLQDDSELTAAQCARRVGCSFAVAWEAHRDWGVLVASGISITFGTAEVSPRRARAR